MDLLAEQELETPEFSSGEPTDTTRKRSEQTTQRARNALSALRLFGLLLALVLLSQFFVVVPAGERGVLLRFGAVQDRVLPEGLHAVLPVRDSVKRLSVRVQSLPLRSEAASRDLQDVAFDVAVSWHILPDEVPQVYRRLGREEAIVATVIEPALEDGLKAVVASFTAEQLITERPAVKEALRQLLNGRLSRYDLALDGVDLLQVDFSERFRQAVEAKQVADQDAKRAEYEAAKARRLADAKVFLAEGEARAQQLLQAGLTPEVLQRQAIEKWNGHLPLVMGGESVNSLNLKSLLKADGKSEGRR
jgi:regulator of protease activity HflC (stomatin/prohibitin superfamily)